MFGPRWTDEIMEEMARTLEFKLKKTPAQTAHLVRELRAHFGDAWVHDYRSIMEKCTNEPKDRHVLAAAIRCDAELVLTFNRKHFPESSLAPWSIEAAHPDDFLLDIFNLHPEAVVQTLHEQAFDLGRDLKKQLSVLEAGLPRSVKLISETLYRRRE